MNGRAFLFGWLRTWSSGVQKSLGRVARLAAPSFRGGTLDLDIEESELREELDFGRD